MASQFWISPRANHAEITLEITLPPTEAVFTTVDDATTDAL